MEHQLLFRTTAKHVNIFIKIMLRDLPIVYSGLLDSVSSLLFTIISKASTTLTTWAPTLFYIKYMRTVTVTLLSSTFGKDGILLCLTAYLLKFSCSFGKVISLLSAKCIMKAIGCFEDSEDGDTSLIDPDISAGSMTGKPTIGVQSL
jgi:hypothetical protein